MEIKIESSCGEKRDLKGFKCMTVSVDVSGNFLRLSNSIELIESVLFNIEINWIYFWIYFIQLHLNQLNHFKMIESIWNNIQIDWLQSPKNNNNKNNNFQTYRTVRVSLTVKKSMPKPEPKARFPKTHKFSRIRQP